MNQPPEDQQEVQELNQYLLKARLKRVSQEILERFLGELKDITDLPKTKESLSEEIVRYYAVMKNNLDFSVKFGNFIRDYVLGAGESEYLVEMDDKEAFIRWIEQWDNNTFYGKRFNFYKNIHLKFEDRFLTVKIVEDGSEFIETIESNSLDSQNEQSLSFPSDALLLVAYSQQSKSIFSKNQLLDIYETFEFEIIFRKDSSLVGVRGNHSVVRDFFTSITQESSENPSSVQSLFVGDFDRSKSRPIARPRKAVDIEKLRIALNGEYLDINAPIAGDQVTRVKLSLKGMRNPLEETHPIFGPAVQEAWKGQEKSRIGFRYNGVEQTFSVTGNGGLYFRQFAPEEVITYVLLKISNL
jgi:hypothetical protein